MNYTFYSSQLDVGANFSYQPDYDADTLNDLIFKIADYIGYDNNQNKLKRLYIYESLIKDNRAFILREMSFVERNEINLKLKKYLLLK